MRDVANVHIVTQIRNQKSIERKGLIEGKDFTTIDSEAVARPLHRLGGILRGGNNKGWTTVQAINMIGFASK